MASKVATRLAFERAIVTGGASSIGLATALTLRDRGLRVAIFDRDAKAIEEALRIAPDLVAIEVDLAASDRIDAALEEAVDRLGGCEILVNNAGIGGHRAPLERIALDDWRQVFAVNVEAALRCMQAVIPGMKAGHAGAIINVVTSSVRTGLPLRNAYVASKAALLALTRNAARELGPDGIRVNAVSPGLIDNPRGQELIRQFGTERNLPEAQAREAFLRHVSMRTTIHPQEVADAIAFLASDKARHITGQDVGVCGNMEWEG